MLMFASAAVLLSSCTTTIPATSKAKMDETIDQVKYDLRQQGYYASGFSSEQKAVHDYGAKSSSGGAGHEDFESNAIINVDTYRFENSDGNKMQFQVQYMVKEDKNGVYLAEVSTMGCESSKVQDYESLCGRHSPIKKLDSMPQDGKAKVANPVGTLWLSIGLGVGLPLIVLLAAL